MTGRFDGCAGLEQRAARAADASLVLLPRSVPRADASLRVYGLRFTVYGLGFTVRPVGGCVAWG